VLKGSTRPAFIQSNADTSSFDILIPYTVQRLLVLPYKLYMCLNF